MCGSTESLAVHHIRPLSHGGDNRNYNLLTLCWKCHRAEHECIRVEGLTYLPKADLEPYRDYLLD